MSGPGPANAVRSASFLCRYVSIDKERLLNQYVSPIVYDLQSGASLGAILELSSPREQVGHFIRIWLTCVQQLKPAILISPRKLWLQDWKHKARFTSENGIPRSAVLEYDVDMCAYGQSFLRPFNRQPVLNMCM